MRQITLKLDADSPCQKSGTRAVRLWLLGLQGVRSAAAGCAKQGTELSISAACRRGNATKCTAALKLVGDMAAAQKPPAGGDMKAAAPCSIVQDVCDAYYGATALKVSECVTTDPVSGPWFAG